MTYSNFISLEAIFYEINAFCSILYKNILLFCAEKISTPLCAWYFGFRREEHACFLFEIMRTDLGNMVVCTILNIVDEFKRKLNLNL